MYIIHEAAIAATPENIKVFKDKIRMECILQTAGDINRNRRMYEKSTLQESIDKIMDRVRGKEFLGELDHPIDSNPARQVTVSYKEASHAIIDLGWDGNKLRGVLETLRTPNGTILKNLAEDGIPVGFSYRGMGDVRPMNEGMGKQTFKVVGPLHTVTWDAVSFPSHKEAKLQEITEGVKTAIYESIDPTMIVSESSNYICLENGVCYLPNDFDRMLEQRKKWLKSKFTS